MKKLEHTLGEHSFLCSYQMF